jgi:hypothetical protein
VVDGLNLAFFIDEHVGYWFYDIARRVALGCNSPFYIALAELPHVWMLRFRAILNEICDCPVPAREQMAVRIHRKLVLDKTEIAPIRFISRAQGQGWQAPAGPRPTRHARAPAVPGEWRGCRGRPVLPLRPGRCPARWQCCAASIHGRCDGLGCRPAVR